MIIINETVRIRKRDKYNLIVERYEKNVYPKTKEEVFKWQTKGYFSRLEDALEEVLRQKLFDSVEEEMQITEVIARIDKAQKEVRKLKVVDTERK